MTDPESRAADLAPCPFCNAEAAIIYDGPTKEQVQHAISWGNDVGDGWYRAQCKSCGASVGEFRHRREVSPAWNRRALTTSAAADAAMREALTYCETVMMIVEPRSNKAEYLAALRQAKAALATPASAQAERMMRELNAFARAIVRGDRDFSGDEWEQTLVMAERRIEALRALGETGET